MDIIQGIVRWAERYKRQRDQTVAGWCQENFTGMAALFRLYRIERRLGRKTVGLKRKFKLNQEPIETANYSPGFYLWKGFRGRR